MGITVGSSRALDLARFRAVLRKQGARTVASSSNVKGNYYADGKHPCVSGIGSFKRFKRFLLRITERLSEIKRGLFEPVERFGRGEPRLIQPSS